MSFTNFVVILIMSRSYFYHTRSKVHIDMLISDNFYFSFQKRELNLLAYKCLISCVIRVNHNCGIPKICLRSGCGNLYKSAAIGKRVFDMIKFSIFFFVFHFNVRERTVMGTPVDHIVSSNDKPFIVKMYKCFTDRFLQPSIHSKTLPLPCRRNTHFAKLLCHDTRRFRFPSPCAF